MTKVVRLLALSLIFLLAPMTFARADLILGNLPRTVNAFQTRTGALGTGFTMTGDYLLTSATFLIAVRNDDTNLKLFSDAGGNPSTSLLTFTNPVFPDTTSRSYTFTAPSVFELHSGTTYWLVLQGTAIGYQMGARTPTGPGATDAGQRFDSVTYPPTTPLNTIPHFQVEGTLVSSVPEPSSLALLGLGLAGVLGHRLHRRKHPG